MFVQAMAWQWVGNAAWANTLVHGMGSFVTSPGFAGMCAVGAASVAAWQVSKTRALDRQRQQDENTARHRDEHAQRMDQLWGRFEWLIIHIEEVGAERAARMLVALEREAAPDSQLAMMIRELRLRLDEKAAIALRQGRHHQ